MPDLSALLRERAERERALAEEFRVCGRLEGAVRHLTRAEVFDEVAFLMEKIGD